MSVLNIVSLLTIFEEDTAAGVGPNGTSGVSTGTEWETEESGGGAFQMPHVSSSLSTSAFNVESLIPDYARRRIFETQRAIEGLSNNQWTFQSYLTGRGSTLAAGTTATATALSRFLVLCMGGVSYTETVTLTGGGHTTTVVNVDDATTLAVGNCIAWEDSNGVCHPRVITNISTLAVTLWPALPEAPSDDDLCRGGATIYIDEDVIGNSAGGLSRTFSACIQKGADASAGWEANGSKPQLTGISFERNAFPMLDFNCFSARFTDPSSGPDPDLSAAVFPTPQVMGPDSQIIIENAGTTTITTVCNGSASIDPGVPVVPLECMADNLGQMEGIGLYSSAPADTLIEVDVYPFATSWYTDKANEQNQGIAITKNGDSGNTFAFFAQNCELVSVAGGDNDFTSSNLTLRAVEHNPSTATTALERSKFRIFIG